MASILAITKAIVLPPPRGFEVSGNSTHVERPSRVRGAGFLHLPVARRNNTNTKPTRKRQSLDELRNDISGYSIQSESENLKLEDANLIISSQRGNTASVG
jgi:hypothetical protein